MIWPAADDIEAQRKRKRVSAGIRMVADTSRMYDVTRGRTVEAVPVQVPQHQRFT